MVAMKRRLDDVAPSSKSFIVFIISYRVILKPWAA
jgi:hypothetical protein